MEDLKIHTGKKNRTAARLGLLSAGMARNGFLSEWFISQDPAPLSTALFPQPKWRNCLVITIRFVKKLPEAWPRLIERRGAENPAYGDHPLWFIRQVRTRRGKINSIRPWMRADNEVRPYKSTLTLAPLPEREGIAGGIFIDHFEEARTGHIKQVCTGQMSRNSG